MKASELRIGNYVADIWNPDIPRQVQSLAKNLCIYGPLRCKYDKLLPIHLTEDWLLKFGFEKGVGEYSIEWRNYYSNGNPHGICIEFVNGEFYYSAGEGIEFSIKYKYVHQLQNLYYALTGEELCTQ